MEVSLTMGFDAHAMLEDREFLKNWRALYEQCSWATPFQDDRFVGTWYRVYGKHFDPVILSESTADGKLVGLLTLAASKGGKLVVAGSHQAEYQVWLATSGFSGSFVRNALQKLGAAYPAQSLTFRYLPPLTPMDWAADHQPHDPYYEIEKQETPLLTLDDPQRLTESLRKKSNKSRLGRLARLGTIEFEEIKTSAALSWVFDEIIAYYDLRQGALHDSVPFRDDPFKKAFYLALMDHGDFLHATVLKVGKVVAAAHLGLCDRGKAYLGVFAYCPFLAQHSPGKFHVLMLGERLAEGHYSALDLTPGDDPWKERFATSHENVHTATVYFNYALFGKHRIQANLKAMSKSVLQPFGLTPRSVKSGFEKLTRTAIAFMRPARNARGRGVLRIYTFKCEDVVKLPHPKLLMNRDRIEDLLDFQSSKPGRIRKEFLATSLARLEAGSHVYTFADGGLLLHYGWLVPQQVEMLFPQVGQAAFRRPPGSTVLYDFFVHPNAKNQELLLSSLSQMLHDAALLGTQQICVAVPADDDQARRAIERIRTDIAVPVGK